MADRPLAWRRGGLQHVTIGTFSIADTLPGAIKVSTTFPEGVVIYLVIHQLEGQIVAPLTQRHMVAIPPAVMLLGIVAITYLFGAIAIISAAPIAVVVFAAVNLLYVRDTLARRRR